MKKIIPLLVLVFCLFSAPAHAVTMVDIYGPGQNMVNLSLAAPLTGPNSRAINLGTALDRAIKEDLGFLPFMRITPDNAVLGGTVLSAWQGAELDFKRFQIAGSDLLITEYWPKGDSGTGTAELRVFETFSGKFFFGNAYSGITSGNIREVADQFCADLMEALTGSGAFFRSTLAFIRKTDSKHSEVFTCSPLGRDMRQITRLGGTALSPCWSPNGRYIVFSHMDDATHALGVWDATTNQVRRIQFPGNTVIGPCFMPDNKVAVSLSTGNYPDIFLLDHSFAKERALESSTAINVSPSFDSSGTKMAFTSSRLGNPQVFLKDFRSGTVRRISKQGGYNSEPSISPDGTLVAYSRQTAEGFRIFVQDLVTDVEQQVSFGPGNDIQPSFAPDSYFIAFSSSRGGSSQIYLTTRHGGDAKAVPGTSGGTFPRWGQKK
ncbi:MAG: PD40 domain-containing protein [Mailhella sp.]|nr:PD40 domain-containing protein [Mailhella sp.]